MTAVESGNVSGDTVGVVFILANEAIPGYIKVGYTADLAGRMKELERVGAVPFPYSILYAAEVENPGAWMRMVREVYSGAKVSTCFFDAGVADEIEGVFRLAKGKELKSNPGKKPRGGRKSTETNGKKTRGRNFDFEMLCLRDGDELEFVGDEFEATCVISNAKPPRVMFGEEELTLSVAAARVMGRESTKGVQGPIWWAYEGENLADRRKRMESELG